MAVCDESVWSLFGLFDSTGVHTHAMHPKDPSELDVVPERLALSNLPRISPKEAWLAKGFFYEESLY